MKIVLRIAASLLLIALVGGLVVHQLIKTEARRFLVAQTGFDLDIGKVKAGLFSTRVEFDDVTVRNPPDFPETTAMVIDRIVLDLNVGSLLRGKTHLTELQLDVPRIVVVRKETGETNFQRMSDTIRRKADEAAQSKSAPTEAPPAQTHADDSAAPNSEAGNPEESKSDTQPEPESVPKTKATRPFLIDRLAVRIGTVEYRDYGAPDAPAVSQIALNVDREAQHVENAQQIQSLLIGGLIGSFFKQALNDGGQSLKAVLEDENLRSEAKRVGKDLKRAFKGFLEQVSQPAGDAAPQSE
ncbi:MAG: AsmA family protein [Verrucomicrobia bacterium]|nr:AsmA family protein [Kiritimatiellia bacterium]MCO6401564.1 AsmA family protein [Verrucomicrobiota bacterium]